MSKITSFSLLGVELVRLAGKRNVVNANGASIHSGLFRDALSTQVGLDRKVARFIVSPVVADEWMAYLLLSDSTVAVNLDCLRYGDVEFLIVGWIPDDVMLLVRPEEIVFRPFSSKRFLSFIWPKRVTLVKNIGRAKVENEVVPTGVESDRLSTLGAHFVDWMDEHHHGVPLDAVPESIFSEYLSDAEPSISVGEPGMEDACFGMSAVGKTKE